MYYHSGCAQPQSPYNAAQVAWAQAHAGQAHVYGPPTPPQGIFYLGILREYIYRNT
jgi:hypothetical protein